MQVSLHRNIGLLVFHLHAKLEGRLCRRCIREEFHSLTGITLLFGWWGLISFFITPFFIASNVAQFLSSRALEEPPEDAVRLTDDTIERLSRYLDEIADRINDEEPIEDIVTNIANRSRVREEEVVVFLHTIFQTLQSQRRRRA